jgi:hypothetical protein
MNRFVFLCLVILGIVFIASCGSPAEFAHLDAQVTVEGNVFLSFDQKKWQSSLNTQDFNVFLSNKYQSFEFRPVTTETGRPPFYEITETEKVERYTGYYEIPIYFKSESLNVIKWKSAALSSLPVAWSPSVDFRLGASDVKTGDEIQASLVNAVRVSVTGQIEDEEHTIVYERPEAYHHNRVLGTGGDLSGDDGAGAPGFLSYYYAQHQSLLFGADYVVCAPTVTQVRESSQLFLTELIQTDDAYFGSIILRVWIERWDPDSYSVVYDTNFSLSLVFVGAMID